MGKPSLQEEQVNIPERISSESSLEISKLSGPLQIGHTKMFINSFFKTSSCGAKMLVT